MRIIDIAEVAKPISSPIRNAYIDFSRMTASLVAVVTDVARGRRPERHGYGRPLRENRGKLQFRLLAARKLQEADRRVFD